MRWACAFISAAKAGTDPDAASAVDPTRQVDHRWGPGRFPGILVGEPDRHVVWGLTYQLLGQLFDLLGTEFPPATPSG